MFYDVRVMDPQGNLKQTIRGRDLAHDHWNKFKKAEEQNSFIRLDRERVLQELKNSYDLGLTSPSVEKKEMQKS